jgi:hypothetical protein
LPVILLLHRRTGSALIVVLIALWTATLACAANQVTPVAQCHRHEAPCCPHTDGQNCANSECAQQAPSKAENRAAQLQRERSLFVAAAVSLNVVRRFVAEPAQELSEGLRYRAAVFRLKDDLRI